MTASAERVGAPVRERSRWRSRLAVFAVCSVVPVALLVALELGLRLAGFGCSTEYLVRRSHEGRVFYTPNVQFYQQFFGLPIPGGHWEEIEFQSLAQKPPGVCRVFVFGESAANGHPPDTAYGFWRILETMLSARVPDRRFEFHCLALPGDNSHAMWAAARACARLQPDFYIVYMGNNEVCGPFGPVSRMAHRPFWGIPLIRANMALSNLRIAQLVAARSWQVRSRADVKPQEVESYYATSLRPGDPRLARTYAHFRRNVEDICRLGTRAGATVILCTPGSNLRDWRPYASEHRAGLSAEEKAQWDAFFQQGVQGEEAHAWADALVQYERAAAIDDTHADLSFRMGSCRLGLGDHDAARTLFLRAQDLDAFPAFSNAAVLSVIREVAASWTSRGVYLADCARDLAASSPHALPGREYFFDAVHGTFDGNAAVAASVFEQVVRVLQAPAGPGLPPPDAAECAERLARTPWVECEHLDHAAALLQNTGWPASQEMVASLRQQGAELRGSLAPDAFERTLDAYRRALELNPDDFYLRERLVQGLMGTGKVEEALEQAQSLVEQCPLRRGSHRLFGFALLRAGRDQEAADKFRATLKMYPDDSEAHFQIGRILQQQGELDQALYHCMECLRRDPDQAGAILSMGQIFEQRGDIPAARAAYERAIATDPHFGLPCEHLDRLLTRHASSGERVDTWRRIVGEHPDIGHPRVCLVRALHEGGRADDARREADECSARSVALPAELTEALGLAPDAGPQLPH